MSKFEPIISHHWKTFLPSAWSELSDSDAMVRQTAQAMEQAVQNLAAGIAGPDVPGETYQGKVSRLMSARMDAESDVIREMLPPPEEHLDAQDAEDVEREMKWLQESRQWKLDLLRSQAWDEVLSRQDLSEEQQEVEVEREYQFLLEQDTLRAAHEEILNRSR